MAHVTSPSCPVARAGRLCSNDWARTALRLSPLQKFARPAVAHRLDHKLTTFISKEPGRQFCVRGASTAGRRRSSTRNLTAAQVFAEASEATNLPAGLKKIVGMFQMVPDPLQRYKQLLFYASKLQPLAAEKHTQENKVEGCVSQVWVVAKLEDGKVYFEADSDSQLTKGLAALLVEGLSGSTPQEIVQVEPDFIEMLGLKQSLTPSRSNGFLNMLRLMQKKTLELFMAQEQAREAGQGEAGSSSNGGRATGLELADGEGGVRARMELKLTEALVPVRLVVEDESHQHAGHGGSKGLRSGETHFRVDVVSEAFEGLSLVKRHRRIYELLDDEIKAGVHALALSTKTPAEAQH